MGFVFCVSKTARTFVFCLFFFFFFFVDGFCFLCQLNCLSVCLSVCPGSFRALPGPAHIYIFFDGFCPPGGVHYAPGSH